MNDLENLELPEHIDILDFFPHEEYRQYQKQTILEIRDYFKAGYEFVILESPTGSGKSAIGLTTGLYYNKAYLLTSQKILQTQYENEYASSDIKILKGKNNYPCIFLDGKETCDNGFCLIGKCPVRSDCFYEIAKREAMGSKIALMNYTYFLNVMKYTTVFKERNVLILDEAHNVEKILMGFIEFSFSTAYLSRLGITSKIPDYENVSQYIPWMIEVQKKINQLMATIVDQLAKFKEESTLYEDKIKELSKEIEMLERLNDKVQNFLDSYNQTEWIFDIAVNEKLKRKTITFKPLTVSYFARSFLFQYCDKKILMSATILDKDNFCKSLGIPFDKAIFIQNPSTFPASIRPIYLTNSGKMNKTEIDGALPNIVADINKILNHHNNEKGLIFTNTYKIAKYIQENLENNFKRRLMLHDENNRDDVLDKFMKSQGPKVLMSPSMYEGIDLKDDLARFVVIVKIPYLFLGDKQIKRRMETDYDWYIWKAALILVQAAGRGVRHKEDECTTYIMDSGTRWFLMKNKKFFPQYFLDAIKN